MRNLIILTICTWSLYSCVPAIQSTSNSSGNTVTKKLRYEDISYESTIKTVQLTPKGNTLLPAVTGVRNSTLRLKFDELTEQADSYRVRIINCTKNWRPSGLNSLAYLTDYNEFDIINYEFSFDTRTPYVHYTFDVPPINRSGNYLLLVYRSDNLNDIVLSKRLMIVEPLVSVAPIASINGLSNLSQLNQQINFTINYPNYNIENPISNLNVSIRQNQRDDNQINQLKPSFLREDINQLEYRFFNNKNTFSAINEFRFFDLKSLLYPGQNVQTVNRSVVPPKASIALDKPRTGLAYAQYEDYNGQFIINDFLDINGHYTKVTFNLDNERIGYSGKVYVFGEFTNWRISDEYEMVYDLGNKVFKKEVLLKQGYYEYQYLTSKDSVTSDIEGNHYQAENTYEIFVYYKPYNERSDLLIGYYQTSRSGINR